MIKLVFEMLKSILKVIKKLLSDKYFDRENCFCLIVSSYKPVFNVEINFGEMVEKIRVS